MIGSWRPGLGRRVRLGSGQQLVGQGVGHGGGSAGHFELGENVLDMVLGGAPADVQGPADVGVGGTIGEQPQYLELARAERWAARIGTGTLAPLSRAGAGA